MDNPFRFSRFCAGCGPVFLLTYFGFWGVLSFRVPPLPATLTAAEMAAYFHANTNQIRLGMVGAMTFVPTYAIWGLGITKKL